MQRSNAPSRMAAWRSALVRRGVFAGLGLALLFLAGGGLALASGAAIGPAVVTLGFGVAIGWVVTAAIYMLTVARPLGRLTQATIALAETDTAALSDALGALAEGDLTRKLKMQARPVAVDGTAEVTRLGDGIGGIISRLGESAYQLNTRHRRGVPAPVLSSAATGTSRARPAATPSGRALDGKGQVLVVTSSFAPSRPGAAPPGIRGDPAGAVSGRRDRRGGREHRRGAGDARRHRCGAETPPAAGRHIRHGRRAAERPPQWSMQAWRAR